MTRRNKPEKPPKRVRDVSLFRNLAINLNDGRLALLYVVLRALEQKDELAQELLDATGYIVFDTEGKQIYPPLQRADDEEHGNPHR